MKKILSITLACLVLALLPIGLVGCKNNSTANIVGTWEYTLTQKLDDKGNVIEEFVNEDGAWSFEVYKNNTGLTDGHTFKWKFNGKKFTIYFYREDGSFKESEEFTYDNGKLLSIRYDDKDGILCNVFKKIK